MNVVTIYRMVWHRVVKARMWSRIVMLLRVRTLMVRRNFPEKFDRVHPVLHWPSATTMRPEAML